MQRRLFFLLALLIFHRITAQKVFMTSIPKTGTNLLMKCLQLVSGKNYIIDAPDRVMVDPRLARLYKPHNFLITHAIYSQHNVNLLGNFKGVFILRDPRDHVVSFAHYIHQNPQAWYSRSKLPFDELILKLICDTYSWIREAPTWSNSIFQNVKGIDHFYGLWLPWKDHPAIYTATFEKLIGSRGSGSDEQQIREIQNIACHIGLHITKEKVEEVAKKLFGGTHTFREGQVGSWKKYFTEEHKKAFKKVAGQLLIDLGYEEDLNW